MRDFIIFCKEFLIPLFVIIIAIGSLFLPLIYFMEKTSCENYSLITNRETRYVFFGGCFVKTTDSWLTKDEYGQVIIAREGLSQQK